LWKKNEIRYKYEKCKYWIKNEIRYKCKKYKWWIFCILVTIAAFVILYRDYPNTDQNNARYILSAISQSLAALLALVITVTVIVAQMMKRYSATKKILFNPGTVFLMIIFGTGIILPLFALKFGWFCIGVNFSIVIAGFCILLLFPFLKIVSDALMDLGYGNLFVEISDAIKSENEAKAVQGIIDLKSICEDAIKEFHEDLVKNILIQLSIIGKKSAEKKFEYATSLVADGLRGLGIGSIEEGFDDLIIEIAVTGLKDIGAEASENRSEILLQTVRAAIDGLEDVGTKAAEKGLVRTTIRAAEGLKDVVVKLSDSTGLRDMKSKNVAANAVQGVWCLGGFVMKYMPERAGTVILNLKEIEKEIGKDLLMKWEKNCVNKYPDLKPFFEEFKRGYDEG